MIETAAKAPPRANEPVDYKDKNVLVVGLGKSGLNSAYLLKELGANVTVNDKKILFFR